MSRVGKAPITIPENVTVSVENRMINVKGPKGEVSIPFRRGVNVAVNDSVVTVTRKNDVKATVAQHGTVRNLINNAITGVREGHQKTLELVGIGYRARMEGNTLNMSLGFSHPVIVEPKEGVTFAVDNQSKVIVSGFDKQLVGQVAADIRAIRPPEPYKGKGIRYENEVIIKKAGKTSKGE